MKKDIIADDFFIATKAAKKCKKEKKDGRQSNRHKNKRG